jgi:TerC family integral membrane protein
LRFLKKHFRTTTEYYNNHFWIRLPNTNEVSQISTQSTIEDNKRSPVYTDQNSLQNQTITDKKNIGTQLWFTPLFLVLILIEVSDLIFAVDSIPAVLAITQNPFIVYTSNIFAVLGLRSLYFVLANLIDRFHYLKPGLAILLTFIGCKMLLAHIYPIPTVVALVVTLGILIVAISASLLKPIKVSHE